MLSSVPGLKSGMGCTSVTVAMALGERSENFLETGSKVDPESKHGIRMWWPFSFLAFSTTGETWTWRKEKGI